MMRAYLTAATAAFLVVGGASAQTTVTKVAPPAATANAADGAATAANDIKPELVRKLMNIAYDTLPSEARKSDGTVVVIDKKKPDNIIIPFEDAKRIVKGANLAADAQICDMPELQTAFHASLVRSERKANNWSDEQIEYVKRLYIFTVSLRVGKLGESEEKPGQSAEQATAEAKRKTEEAKNAPPAFTCSVEKKARTKADIESFIATASKS